MHHAFPLSITTLSERERILAFGLAEQISIVYRYISVHSDRHFLIFLLSQPRSFSFKYSLKLLKEAKHAVFRSRSLQSIKIHTSQEKGKALEQQHHVSHVMLQQRPTTNFQFLVVSFSILLFSSDIQSREKHTCKSKI